MTELFEDLVDCLLRLCYRVFSPPCEIFQS
jgi:hypothetical protein